MTARTIPSLLATFCIAAVLASVAGQATAQRTVTRDAPTSRQLTVFAYVLDSDNNTLPEVNLRYSIAGGEWKSAITARDGVARIYGKVPGESIRVEVDDARWDCPEGAIDTTVGGSPIALRVFPSDSSQMTREERMAAHRLRIRTLIEERRQAEAQTELATIEGGTTGTLIPSDTSAAAPQVPAVYQDPLWGFAANRHILAFLEGLRMEASPAVEAGDGTTTYATRIESRLINGLGHPIADVEVELWQMKESKGVPQAALAETGRTYADGSIEFSSLVPDTWYRLECRDSTEGVGRSTVFQVKDGESKRISAIVVRPEDRGLSGFVMRTTGPARFARIQLLDESGQSLLSTTADTQGFFVLGPIPADPTPVALRVFHAGPERLEVTVPVAPDRELPEMIIPLDALARELGSTGESEAATP